MAKKYEIPEVEQGIVSEASVVYNPTISTLDALWALVLDQADDVQRNLEVRLRHLLQQRDELYMPYTAEELHERIAMSEKQFSQGECFSHAEVRYKVNELLDTLTLNGNYRK